jgi:hypothetical protein
MSYTWKFILKNYSPVSSDSAYGSLMSAISLLELFLWATISELLTSIVILGAVKFSIEVFNADSITVT